MYFIFGLLSRWCTTSSPYTVTSCCPAEFDSCAKISSGSFPRLVLGGEEQRRQRLERSHQLVELVGREVLVRLRREVVGARLDALLDGATLFAQPPVVTDEATSAHAVLHPVELRGRKVVD